jgi:hypothetical protein
MIKLHLFHRATGSNGNTSDFCSDDTVVESRPGQQNILKLFRDFTQNLQANARIVKLNSVALVRERNLPTERLVGGVSAKFCGYRVLRGQRNGFPQSLIMIF